MNLIRKWIFLPIEVKSRELIPKLLFADLASREGYGVFIGRNGMNISRDKFPQGLYFDKCLSPHKISAHRLQVKTFGNTLVSLDEEGFITDEKTYAKARFTQESIDLTSVIFTWGKKESSMILEQYKAKEKLRVSGSPRIDSWRPEFKYLFEPEMKDIHHRFGDFILVNSNFGAPPALPGDRYDDAMKQYIDLLKEIREKFIELIREIAKEFPSRNVVLRPHPGEDQGLWIAMKSELPKNVHIILEGSVSPWIRSASLLLHHNCTTAVEAWVSGTPAISYEPLLDSNLNYEPFHDLPSTLGIRAVSVKDALTAIREYFSGDCKHRSQDSAKANDYFLFDEHEFSSQKILAEINKLPIEECNYKIPSFTAWKKFRSAIGRIKYRLSDMWGANWIPLSYSLQKNSGMSLEEISDLASRLQVRGDQSCGTLKVHQVDMDTFCLYRG